MGFKVTKSVLVAEVFEKEAANFMAKLQDFNGTIGGAVAIPQGDEATVKAFEGKLAEVTVMFTVNDSNYNNTFWATLVDIGEVEW